MPGRLPPATVGRDAQSRESAGSRLCGLGSALGRSEKVASVSVDTDVPLCQSRDWSSVLVSPIGAWLSRCSCVPNVITLAACACSKSLPCGPWPMSYPSGPLGSEGCRIPPCLGEDGMPSLFMARRAPADVGLRHPLTQRSLPGASLSATFLRCGWVGNLNLSPVGARSLNQMACDFSSSIFLCRFPVSSF